MRTLFVVSCFALLMASSASAIEVTKTLVVEESTDKTAEDIPVAFELERAEWTGETLQLWGKVRNNSPKNYRYVELVFTVYTAEGKFITRSRADTYPDLLGSKKVSFVEATYIQVNSDQPAKVTVKALGEVDDEDDF